MAINADKPLLWKNDIAKSVDFYNNWFMNFAPKTYRETRLETTKQVVEALKLTQYLVDIDSKKLAQNPQILSILRMVTAPPIARDRLIGLASVSSNLVKNMELNTRIPPKMDKNKLESELTKIGKIIGKLIDKDLFPWLDNDNSPDEESLNRASTIVADRLCGAVSDPIIRNAQERRQLEAIKSWLDARGYHYAKSLEINNFKNMKNGTYSFRLNIPVKLEDGSKSVNIPVDAVIKPHNSKLEDFPLLFEAKSAGDFTNTNKRRKEEALKIAQLRNNYGNKIKFILFLCGYFDSGYLGYEAAEGIDWIWEHKIDDMSKLGL